MTVVITILAKNSATDILSMYLSSVERCHSLVKVDHPWQPGNIYASGCWQTEGKKPSILVIAYGLQLQLCWSLLHKQITGPTRKALYTVSRDFSWTAVFLGDIYRKLRQLPQT